MSDYVTKVHRKLGGDELAVVPGGKITIGGVALTCNAAGNLIATGLPTADPGVVGALWNSSGTLRVSAG